MGRWIRQGVLAMGLAWGAAAPVQAAGEMQELLHETQIMHDAGGGMTMAWWLPDQFWAIAMAGNPDTPPGAAKKVTDLVQGYLVFAVMSGTIGSMGGYTGKTDAVIAGTTVEVDGRTFTPLKNSELSPDVRNLFAAMTPMLGNMLGPFGQSMQFVAFRNEGSVGHHPVDAAKAGKLELHFAGEKFPWRLPLGSLLPRKTDPATAETFPGNYLFNPFTGAPLK